MIEIICLFISLCLIHKTYSKLLIQITKMTKNYYVVGLCIIDKTIHMVHDRPNIINNYTPGNIMP